METLLVKIFATALALSQVTTTPDAVPVRLEEGQTALNRVPHSGA